MQQTVEVTGDIKSEVIGYADPVTDNLMEGFNENNYSKYSRDFSEVMKRSLTATNFDSQREDIISRIGLYLSRRNPKVYERGKFIWAEYYAEFEKETSVQVRVVFAKEDPDHLVEGLWFDSPKLRE